jgi:hypothetical protein
MRGGKVSTGLPPSIIKKTPFRNRDNEMAQDMVIDHDLLNSLMHDSRKERDSFENKENERLGVGRREREPSKVASSRLL